jgi:predicted RecB family nuclease
MKADQDGPWHDAKAKIGAALADLTLLPRVNLTHRARAHDAGVTRWDDPRVSAELLGIANEREAAIVDAVLTVNRNGGVAIVPERITAAADVWRHRAPVEVFVDFEFLPDLNDDFAAFPRKGGQALIFQIGCGTYRDGEWRFRQFTTDELSLAAEARMIDAWLAHLHAIATEAGCVVGDIRLVHWSPAETSNFERAYDNARVRHPDRDWPELSWFDLLHDVVQAEPLVVRGAFSFSLKPIARSLHALGHIQTLWGDGLADGAGAMAGAWNAAVEARRKGVTLEATEVMGEIARYNEVDCRVMAEILDYLRRER